MGLLKILPRPFRIAIFYVKVKKRPELLEKIEAKCGGERYFLSPVKPTMVCVIGKKDIGALLIESGDYPKAIRYLTSATDDLEAIRSSSNDSPRVIMDNTVLTRYYLADAYAMNGEPERAEQYFDSASEYITGIIEKEPDNSRAVELYNYFIVKKTISALRKAVGKNPDKEAQYNLVAKRLYLKYDARDKGNDRINEVLALWN